MKLKKSSIQILLIELIGVIIFLSIALVMIVTLYTGVYKLMNETKDLAVGSRVIQNIAEYCKSSSSKEECEALLDQLGSRVHLSNGIGWEISYSKDGEIIKSTDEGYSVSVVMKGEVLIKGEWITVTLTAQRENHTASYKHTIQALEINKYYVKRG